MQTYHVDITVKAPDLKGLMAKFETRLSEFVDGIADARPGTVSSIDTTVLNIGTVVEDASSGSADIVGIPRTWVSTRGFEVRINEVGDSPTAA